MAESELKMASAGREVTMAVKIIYVASCNDDTIAESELEMCWKGVDNGSLISLQPLYAMMQ